MDYKNKKKVVDPKQSKVNVDGKIIEVLPDTKYKVEIKVGTVKHIVVGYPSGKMRKNYIKLLEGDDVIVEITPEYDLNVGRIVWKKSRRSTVPASLEPKKGKLIKEEEEDSEEDNI